MTFFSQQDGLVKNESVARLKRKLARVKIAAWLSRPLRWRFGNVRRKLLSYCIQIEAVSLRAETTSDISAATTGLIA